MGDRAPEPEKDFPYSYWESFLQSAVEKWNHRHPAPVPPVEGEVAELVAWLRNMANAGLGGLDELNAARAADLLEQQATAYAICERERLHQSTKAANLEIESHPAPVPVSERLPEATDCDDKGRCWWLTSECEGEFSWECLPNNKLRWSWSHWLPIYALPLPPQLMTMLTDNEIEKIADKCMVMDGETGAMFLDTTEFAHAIITADRSKRPFPLDPIPLSERRPDCFGSMCWFYESCDESWDYMDCYSMNLERPGHGWTHWLPGHAFPLPPEDV